MAMLDLSVFQEECFDLKMFDGEELHLRKPTQALLLEILGYQKKIKGVSDPVKIIEAFSDILTKVLNMNNANRVFTSKEIKEKFSPEIGNMVIEEYMKFVNGINSNPN